MPICENCGADLATNDVALGLVKGKYCSLECEETAAAEA